MELINKIDETITFNNNAIRVLGTYNDPWFVAKDICNILEIKDVSNAIINISEKWKDTRLIRTPGGEQNMRIINEAGLYKLIMRSNKPVAQKFQEVVCEEILPSLRKKGEYKIQSIIDNYKKLEEEKNLLEEEKNLLEEEKNLLEEEKNLLEEDKLILDKEKNLLEEENIKKDLQIKKLQNKVLTKQKRVFYDNKNFIYMIQDEFHKKERIYVIGKAIDLAQRLTSYNKARDYEVIYHRCCNSAQQMNYIEKCVLSKLDKYREVANRDRFILPEDQNISIFTDVIDFFVNGFADVDSSVDIEKDLTEDEIELQKKQSMKEYIEDNREKITECRQQYRKDNEEQLSDFNKVYRENNKETIAEYQKSYREVNNGGLKIYNKNYYECNKDTLSENNKVYSEEHREEIREFGKNYYENHKEEFAKYKKEFYEENKASVIQRSKDYYDEHKEDVLARTKEHYKNNKEKILKYQSDKVKCECGIVIQRNYMSKHKLSGIHKLSLENKEKGKTIEKDTKVECECGHKVNIGYTKRHLNSKIHAISMKLKSKHVIAEIVDEVVDEVVDNVLDAIDII